MKISIPNPIFSTDYIIINSNSKFFLKKLQIVNNLHWCLFTIYCKNVSATNSNITRQCMLDNW